MSIDETLTRSIEERLSGTAAPRFDAAALRRAGRRRRRVRTGMIGAAALAVVVAGTGAFLSVTDRDGEVRPAGVPALDFSQGLQAYYDESRRELHLGGATFDPGVVSALDLSAAATPWGAVYFSESQEVRLLDESGAVRTLAAAPGDPDPGFSPTVKYDAGSPLLAWMTGSGDDDGAVRVTVYDVDSDRVVLDQPWSCPGGCSRPVVAGLDDDHVFVRDQGPDRGLVTAVATIDGDQEWTTWEGVEVSDVRNRVMLVDKESRDLTAAEESALGGGSWRTVRGQGPESLLTLDGGHEVYWSTTLRSTSGGAPMRLQAGGKEGVDFVTLDSDGSVLLGRMTNEIVRYFDCEVPSGACTQIGTLPGGSGDPVFLGHDM